MEHSFISPRQCGHSFLRVMRLRCFFAQMERLRRADAFPLRLIFDNVGFVPLAYTSKKRTVELRVPFESHLIASLFGKAKETVQAPWVGYQDKEKAYSAL